MNNHPHGTLFAVAVENCKWLYTTFTQTSPPNNFTYTSAELKKTDVRSNLFHVCAHDLKVLLTQKITT
jgi:hypothetical protein